MFTRTGAERRADPLQVAQGDVVDDLARALLPSEGAPGRCGGRARARARRLRVRLLVRMTAPGLRGPVRRTERVSSRLGLDLY